MDPRAQLHTNRGFLTVRVAGWRHHEVQQDGRRPVAVLVTNRTGIRLWNAERAGWSCCVLLPSWWSNRMAVFGSGMRFAGRSCCRRGATGATRRRRATGRMAAARAVVKPNCGGFLVNPVALRPLDMCLPTGHPPPSVRGRVLRPLSSRCGVLWGSQIHHWRPGRLRPPAAGGQDGERVRECPGGPQRTSPSGWRGRRGGRRPAGSDRTYRALAL